MKTLSLFVLLLALSAGAQETNVFVPDAGVAPDPSVEAMRYMVSNALAQFGEVISTNNLGTNEFDQTESTGGRGGEETDTNVTNEAEAQGRSLHHESRSQWLDRQRARLANAAASAQAGDSGQGGQDAQGNNAPTRPDYSTFQIVNDGNIFDPNRRPRRSSRSGPREPTVRSDAFSLVGTMSYEKGTFAFFDGTRSDYRKALKLSDTIAGYKITNITPDAVQLTVGTNRMELRVGSQLRREQGGEWVASTQPETYAAGASAGNAGSATNAATEATTGGAESDVIKRMMQRREQE